MTTLSEEWRIIEKWPDYEVSDLGRVRRCAPWHRNKNGRLVICSPRKKTILKPFPIEGYPSITLCKERKQTNIRIYVLVCTTFHGPRPTDSHEVAHWDGDRNNSNASNLRWATRLENVSDTKRHGRDNAGERCGASKLTEKQVTEIIARIAGGEKQRTIARNYGVGEVTISNIKHGKVWRHIAAQGPFA